MSPSEIAFLALGLVLGTVIGAAFMTAVRSRPAPRREVRITVTPNSIRPRRTTLASPTMSLNRGPLPGSPEAGAWPENHPAVAAAQPAPAAAATAQAPEPRTRVRSAPVSLPASAVAVPVNRAGPAVAVPVNGASPAVATGTTRMPAQPAPRRQATQRASAWSAGAATAVAVLDAAPSRTTTERSRVADEHGHPNLSAAVIVGQAAPDVAIRPRPPVQAPAAVLPARAVALDIPRGGSLAMMVPLAMVSERPLATAGSDPGQGTPGGPIADAPGAPASDCVAERHLVEERCSLADAAREQARLAAESLREAQRAYDSLRDRVERAQTVADPREIRASKDAAHRAFRAARAAAMTHEAVEAAARDWLNEINNLNNAARVAAHAAEAGATELRAQLPRLERLAVEADAARITAEGADAGCHEARLALARCEEHTALAAAAAAAAAASLPPLEEEAPVRDAWPTEEEVPLRSAVEAEEAGLEDVAVIVRVLRGDRAARERLVATLSASDSDGGRQWQLWIAQLVDAIVARAIEAGYMDLPDEEPFWGMFTQRERREIVAALSALGFRFDGMGGFADDRVPAQRDLSLAVGYAGLDRMRIRNWPREEELRGLYANALVAADEWLADEAGDLSLGRMVDALGARAGELADVWNAWGRVRPALLATT